VRNGRGGESNWQLLPWLPLVETLARHAWNHRLWLLSGAVAAGMMLTRERWSLAVAVGATWCTFAALWALWRDVPARPAWLAMAIGLAAFAIAGTTDELAARRGVEAGAIRFVDACMYVFAICTALAQFAWPEMRQFSRRVTVTLADLVTLVSASVLWASVGFPPLDVIWTVGSLGTLVQSAEFILPLLAIGLVSPQLPRRRRRTVGLIGVALASGLAADLLGNSLQDRSSTVMPGAMVFQIVEFMLLFWAALDAARGDPVAEAPPAEELAPPFVVPGVLGLAALVSAAGRMSSLNAPQDLFVLAVGGSLVAREFFRVAERHRWQERTTTSLELEARLLDLHADALSDLSPERALRDTCHLAAEVLRATGALAWTAEDESLRLLGAGPARRESLAGRKVSLAEIDCLAVRVFLTGSAEVCTASALTEHTDRFFATVMDAASMLAVPMIREGTTIGTLVLARDAHAPAFSQFDERKAALIASQAAGALRRLELYGELKGQVAEDMLVHRFATRAVGARNASDIALLLLEHLQEHSPFDRASVCLTDDVGRGRLIPLAHLNPGGSRWPRIAEGIVNIRVPLQAGLRVVGYVDLDRANGRPFTPDEERVALRLVEQAATAMQSVRLQEESSKAATYRELDRLKTDLLNAVSHDLRAPLANIKAYASTLVDAMDAMDADEQLVYLKTIEEESDRLRDLLEHLLDLSKIEAGVLQVDLQPVSLPRIIDQTLHSIARTSHTFEVDVSPDLFVLADGRRLRQVLHNLIENAVKYSPDGGPIVVGARVTGREVQVAVQDHGIGIAAHQRDRVFQPYQRADTAKTRRISGNGLGLAICKGIIEAHHGRIWVDSEAGVGSTFVFTLQYAAIAASEELAHDSAAYGVQVG
jgi:signal transduction histidine kinase